MWEYGRIFMITFKVDFKRTSGIMNWETGRDFKTSLKDIVKRTEC